MEMKNPSHPGRLIREDIEALGISIAEAASALGVTRQQLYRIVNGESGVSADMAWRLEKAIGSTADFWLNVQLGYDLAQIRNRRPQPVIRKIKPKKAA